VTAGPYGVANWRAPLTDFERRAGVLEPQGPEADHSRAARFGIKVENDNGHHVRFSLYAATGGQWLGSCGQLVMRADEYAAFRALLEPALTDRPDPAAGQAPPEADYDDVAPNAGSAS
jgi:hypothetical protein